MVVGVVVGSGVDVTRVGPAREDFNRYTSIRGGCNQLILGVRLEVISAISLSCYVIDVS